MRILIVVFLIQLTYSNEPIYKSKEFIDGTNHLGTVYMCAFVSDKFSFSNDSYKVLEKFEMISGVSDSLSKILISDSKTWYLSKNTNDEIGWKKFWESQCKIPMDNIRQISNKEIELLKMELMKQIEDSTKSIKTKKLKQL